jgi:hypothetical protein
MNSGYLISRTRCSLTKASVSLKSGISLTHSDAVFLIFTIIYAVDLLVRFYGLGLRSFRSNGWNIFDVIVVTGSFATTIPAIQAQTAGVPPNQVNGQLQRLFLVSVSLKLVQRSSALNQLFKTSV